MDLRENIERELASEPADFLVMHEVLEVGRRALLRRRITSTLSGVAAAVTVVAGLVMVVNIASGDPDRTKVASLENSTRCREPSAGRSSEFCLGQAALDGHHVAYRHNGVLAVREGWTVQIRVDDPLSGIPGAALAVSNGTDAEWALLKQPGPEGGGGALAEHVDPSTLPSDLTFESWLDGARAHWLGTPATSLVRYDSDGNLQALPGWTVLQQAANVNLPVGYRGPQGVSAVMELDGGDIRWYLVRPVTSTNASLGAAEAFPLLGPDFNSPADALAFASSPSYDINAQSLVAPQP